ncbi:MAG: potassium channel family protein [Candidatus Heimdallarchaeaceae archaeon]
MANASSVKDILIEMKTLSEICVDLAFASLMYSDKLVAKQVFVIEKKIDQLYRKLLDHLSLSIKSQSMAEQLRIYYLIGEATNIISDSAADMASLVQRGILVDDEIKLLQDYMEQVVDLVRISEESILCGESELSSDIHDLIGVDIVGIIRPGVGFFTEYDKRMQHGDLVIFRAPLECANAFIKLAKGEYNSVEEARIRIIEQEEEEPSNTLKRHQRLLIEMKEKAELLVDFAYILALEDLPAIRNLIIKTEENVDDLQYEIIDEVLKLFKEDKVSEKTLMAYLRMADSFEEIADAAIKIAFGVATEHKPYRLLEEVVDDSSEALHFILIDANSPFLNKTVREAEQIDDFFQILAVRKRGKFNFDPDENLILKKGDGLIVKEFSSPEDE